MATVRVQMRLKQSTIDSIDEMCEAMDVQNRTLVVTQAVRLAHWMIQKKQEGAILNVEHQSGQKEYPPLVGF